MESVFSAFLELRQTTRRLARSPGYAAAIVVNLVLGVATTAGMFVVLNDVVLAPLPYPDSGRLVVIEHEMPGIQMEGQPTRFGAFQGLAGLYRERSRQIEHVGVYGAFDAAINDRDDPRYIRVGYASQGFFAALGMRPAVGTLITAPGTPEGGERQTILSHDIWRTRYGSAPEIVGSFLQVEGFEREIRGVMPSGETFPLQPVGIWNSRPAATVEANPEWLVDGLVARISAAATVDSLGAELDSIIAELPARTSDDFVARAVSEGRLRSRVTPMHQYVVGDVSQALWLMFAGALLVFIASLFNVTSLAIVRGQARKVEMEVRAAIGASARQLRTHRLAEAAVLAVAAGAASYLLVHAGVTALRRLAPPALPRLDELGVGAEAVVLVGLLSLVTATWITIVASLGSGTDAALRTVRVGAAGGRGGRLVRDILAAAQLGVAVVLLISTGLLSRSFVALSNVDPGFDPTNVVTFRVPFPLQEVQQAGAAGGTSTPFYDTLVERIRQIPGVVAAGYGKCAPLSDTCGLEGLTLDRSDATIDPSDAGALAGIAQIAPGYLNALGIPLLSGRGLELRDHEERTNAILISAGLAARLWPEGEPLGKTLVTRDLPGWSPFTVVGVVADARHSDLRSPAAPIAYVPVFLREQAFELWTTSFAVRTAAAPSDLLTAVRAIVREVRPDIPLARVETMSGRLNRVTSGMRLGTVLLAVSAAATLLLGALGIYAVIAYAVTLRRGEFGIRMAVGATTANLRWLVFRHAALVTLVGSTAGVAAALVLGGFLDALLYEVPTTDPATYGVVVLLLALVAAAATALPANRAARTDPAVVLRAC